MKNKLLANDQGQTDETQAKDTTQLKNQMQEMSLETAQNHSESVIQISQNVKIGNDTTANQKSVEQQSIQYKATNEEEGKHDTDQFFKKQISLKLSTAQAFEKDTAKTIQGQATLGAGMKSTQQAQKSIGMESQGGLCQAYDIRLLKLIINVLTKYEEEFEKQFEQELWQFIRKQVEAITPMVKGATQYMNVVKSNLKLSTEDNSIHFEGHPEMDFAQQLAIIMGLWNRVNKFPVKFIPLEGFNDETNQQIVRMNQLTPIVKVIFSYLSQNHLSSVEAPLKDLLVKLDQRGIMTCMGFRSTQGSLNVSYPTQILLLEAFQKQNQQIRSGRGGAGGVQPQEHPKRKNVQASTLTCGARALAKHAHRSSEGFWGDTKGSEAVKNQKAFKIAEKMLEECVWINTHIMVHTEKIIEFRIKEGYGLRWTLDGEFRGFLEPQMAGGHEKGWKH